MGSIKPLQFLAGPADEKLVTALKVFMKEVDQIYELEKPAPKDDDEVVDIDELGEAQGGENNQTLEVELSSDLLQAVSREGGQVGCASGNEVAGDGLDAIKGDIGCAGCDGDAA